MGCAPRPGFAMSEVTHGDVRVALLTGTTALARFTR